MAARAKRLVYEVPAKLEVGHVVRASWLGQALEAPCLVVADLEQVDADNSTCKRLVELYQSVVGERLHLVYESELLELGRAYRRLSAKVSVCSLLKHQREVERPLTHAELSRALALAAVMVTFQPEEMAVEPSALEALKEAAHLVESLAVGAPPELVTDLVEGVQGQALMALPLPREGEALEFAERLPIDPLKAGGGGRPRFCSRLQLLKALQPEQAASLEKACKTGSECSRCSKALAEALQAALGPRKPAATQRRLSLGI
jgi:bacterioferritin-associated ferredoxin